MNDLGITPEDRQVVVAARSKADETGGSALALELPNGQIVTGKIQNSLVQLRLL